MKRFAHSFSLIFIVLFGCGSDDGTDGMKDDDGRPEDPIGCFDSYAVNYQENTILVDTECDYNPVACSSCDFVVPSDDLVIDNDDLDLPAGSVICFSAGSRVAIKIMNFQGEEGNPYIFSNCDGQALFDQTTNQTAIRVENSSFLRITGTGSDDKYGIKVTAGSAAGLHGYGKVTDIEVDHLDITGTELGIWIVTRPECDGSANKGTFTQRNTIIHNNYIHDVGTEGMYIGGSKWDTGFSDSNTGCGTLEQADLVGVRIFRNRVIGTGWDGIQVGGAIEDSEIFSNEVADFGLKNNANHRVGIMINPGTTGKVFSNLVNKGKGFGIALLGFDLLVHSNLLVDCEEGGIHFGDRSPLPNKSYRILNNTLVDIPSKAFNMNSKVSTSNIIANNFIVNTDNEGTFNNSDILKTHNVMVESLDGFDFKDPANLDYTPLEGNALIDSSYMDFDDNLIVDILLRERESGGRLDIGAFEAQQQDE
ncbi:MAG: hypothetical protein Tsb0034_13280 [Ekhidna sp.]